MATQISNSRRVALRAALLLLSAAVAGGAQTAAPDSRWEPWIGCWQPVPQSHIVVTATLPVVCVTPTSSASAVQISTIDSGRVVTRDTVNANSARVAVNKEGCSGWQQAQWSADSRRVYLRSELACTAGLMRTSTGLLAISPEGEWLDIQSVAAGNNSGVRAIRYRETAVSAEMPAEISGAIRSGRGLATSTARSAAGGALNEAMIVEAVKQVDTAVVQSWIVERGRQFALNEKTLIALADAGVPGSVTDVLIGVSYPKHFALRQPSTQMAGGGEFTHADSARLASEYLLGRCFGGIDPFWSMSYGLDACSRYGYLGYSSYGRYRYSRLGLGGYGAYGYDPYYSGGYVRYVPVVVERGGTQDNHGRLVKGRGYTRGESSTASSGSSGSGGSRSGSSGGSSSSGSSSSGSGSSSSGSGRTAHPKPPA